MAHPDPQPIPELKSGKRSKAPTSRRSQPGALKQDVESQEAGRGSGLLQVSGVNSEDRARNRRARIPDRAQLHQCDGWFSLHGPWEARASCVVIRSAAVCTAESKHDFIKDKNG